VTAAGPGVGTPCYRQRCKCCTRWGASVASWVESVKAHELAARPRRWWQRRRQPCRPGCLVCAVLAGAVDAAGAN